MTSAQPSRFTAGRRGGGYLGDGAWVTTVTKERVEEKATDAGGRGGVRGPGGGTARPLRPTEGALCESGAGGPGVGGPGAPRGALAPPGQAWGGLGET